MALQEVPHDVFEQWLLRVHGVFFGSQEGSQETSW